MLNFNEKGVFKTWLVLLIFMGKLFKLLLIENSNDCSTECKKVKGKKIDKKTNIFMQLLYEFYIGKKLSFLLY